MFNIREIQEHVILNAVTSESDEATAREIVCRPEESNPEWVKNTMKRMEGHFSQPVLKRIRMSCQCGYAMEEKLQLVQEVKEATSSLEEFGRHPKALASGLSYSDGAIMLMFPFCHCPMVAEVDKLDSYTWCQCTTGYSKVLFEKAFGCEVEVDLLKSIKAGDEICLMRIVPLAQVW